MFRYRTVRISDNWNGEEKIFSHEDMCPRFWCEFQRNITPGSLCVRPQPITLYGDKKEINNKCAILIYYIIINKYMFIRYSFKPFLM